MPKKSIFSYFFRKNPSWTPPWVIFFQNLFSDPKVLPYVQKKVKSCLVRKINRWKKISANFSWNRLRTGHLKFSMNEKSKFIMNPPLGWIFSKNWKWPKLSRTSTDFQNSIDIWKDSQSAFIYGSIRQNRVENGFGKSILVIFRLDFPIGPV